MIAGVRVAFDELLQEVTWMNDATREKAKEKVSINYSRYHHDPDLSFPS